MAKCSQCGKKGFFLRLENGLCADCISENEKAKRLEMEAAQKAAEEKRLRESMDPSNLLEKVTRQKIPRPSMYNGLPMVYDYVIRALDVNRPALYEMAKSNDYFVQMSIAENGDVLLSNNDILIAKLGDKIQIATDWIKKDLPYICQFTGFRKKDECVVLYLYRNDEERLSRCKMSIAKLTSCTSDDRQCNIGYLEEGQKLFVEEDDDGKWYVRDINFHDVGRLPAKFNRMFEDGSLRGIFFDHTEEVENANGYCNDIPFVRFYYD